MSAVDSFMRGRALRAAMPVLPDDFTRADLATWLNALAVFGTVALVIVVLLLAVIAFRGR